MPFVKVEDALPEHPKVVLACDQHELAGWLYVAGLCYCNRNRTDGHIPAPVAKRLIHGRRIPGAIEALIAAGLWETAEGGYSVHDYLEHQSSAEEIADLSVKRSESGRRGGRQSQANRKQIA